ncbi:C4-dicarboxylate ABC transporter [Acinetobacter sp. WCHAc010034]|uniref:TDT family transporter n=1 Tax=Acinetobacter sp. WCHAc010034 TaxID=1879049 RepID=UPI000839F0D3|nr:TDT family transporter [Acinetobacter sp. WCHAc010034]AYA03315.1 C4-dicarboxylate ABC transporter [Acinetobacter sp. WCHAc010034]
MKKPFYQLQQKQDLIRQFTPNWFTVTMGTGVAALVLAELPFANGALWQIGAAVWHFNIGLFAVFSALYALRWLLYPDEARQIFSHPAMSLFLGAIPMGLATILNGLLKFGAVLYGDIAVQIAQLLWYADAALALLIAWCVPFFMYSRQRHELKSMTAVWLLPIVACEVAAASGGLLLGHMDAGPHAAGILLGSYVLWGISVLPAFAVLTILMLRLALHQLPPKEMAISSWLALGPVGTGALALLALGQHAPQVLAAIRLQALGELFQHAGIFAALLLLGFGLWWLGIAVLSTLSQLKGLPFNLGWWGLTFPLGVFTLAMLNLGQQLQIGFFCSAAYALGAVLIGLWLMVAYQTAKGCYRGSLFFSPCLKAYLEQRSS